jgi:hypothetical protein
MLSVCDIRCEMNTNQDIQQQDGLTRSIAYYHLPFQSTIIHPNIGYIFTFHNTFVLRWFQSSFEPLMIVLFSYDALHSGLP